MKHHNYAVQMQWIGNTGEGTKSYASYRRDYRIQSAGKPAIEGSSDPAFLGDKSRYNPEELLVASLSSCHMLWYLHLCATNRLVVLSYDDNAQGVMEEGRDGSGKFVSVELRPKVTIASGGDLKMAAALHEQAHAKCFIANSVNFLVEISPTATYAA